MDYDNTKIKDLIIGPQAEGQALVPDYAQSGIQRRTIDNSEEGLIEKAINVADRAMSNPDDKIALDAANKAMVWLGKGNKGKTVVIAENAQINQLDHDPKLKEHVLDALKDITKITNGIQTDRSNHE